MISIRAIVLTISRFSIGITAVVIGLSVSLAAAEANDWEQHYTCPVETLPSITILEAEGGVSIVDEKILSSASISNQTNYSIGGVRVGFALFEPGGVYPKYWTVLPEAFQFSPYATVIVPLEFDLKNVALGGYEGRVVAVQGDETAVLGALLHSKTPKLSGIVVRKQSNPAHAPVVSLEVEEGVADRNQVQLQSAAPFTVRAEVKNEDLFPLLDSKLVVVVTEGVVPLGAAVRSEKTAVVTLVPASTQATVVRNVQGGAGDHTVYAALVTEGVLQPVERIDMRLPGNHEGRWSYISRVGLSDYPLDEEAEVVACVDVVGDELGTADFSEELGITLSVRGQSNVLAQQTMYSSDVLTRGFVMYQPQVEAKNVIVTADLLQLRFPSYVETSDEVSFKDIIRGQLVPVQTLSQVFVCRTGDACNDVGNETVVTGGTTPQKPFWFYGGIVIAAALLMYLMLRRLPGGVGDTTSSKELSSGELQ